MDISRTTRAVVVGGGGGGSDRDAAECKCTFLCAYDLFCHTLWMHKIAENAYSLRTGGAKHECAGAAVSVGARDDGDRVKCGPLPPSTWCSGWLFIFD